MKTIIDGIATEYQDAGTGPVVLMLHGWQNDLHSFDQLAKELVEHFRVVRIDLPGFGSSEQPPANWNLNNYAGFIGGFIGKLNLSPDILLGHSFGGRIIIKGIANKVFAPNKVILIASGGISKSQTFRNQFYKILAKIGKVIFSVPPLTVFRVSIRRKLYDSAKSDYLQTGVLKDIYLNTIREDLKSSASKIFQSTLLIWGDKDLETPLSDGQTFSQLIKNSELAVYPGGHHIHQEQAVEIAQKIKQFLL